MMTFCVGIIALLAFEIDIQIDILSQIETAHKENL